MNIRELLEESANLALKAVAGKSPALKMLVYISILFAFVIGFTLHVLLAIGTRIMTGKWDW